VPSDLIAGCCGAESWWSSDSQFYVGMTQSQGGAYSSGWLATMHECPAQNSDRENSAMTNRSGYPEMKMGSAGLRRMKFWPEAHHPAAPGVLASVRRQWQLSRTLRPRYRKSCPAVYRHALRRTSARRPPTASPTADQAQNSART
jgi:hypothetical protein